jgi:hypothetical protein
MAESDPSDLQKRLSRFNIDDDDYTEFKNYLKDTIGGRQVTGTWQAVVASDVSKVDLASIKQLLGEIKSTARDPARGQLSYRLQDTI